MSLKPTCQCHDHSWDQTLFDDAAAAVRRVAVRGVYVFRFTDLKQHNNPHKWHLDLQQKYTLHPVVKTLLQYKPKSYIDLMFEWPHVSEKDPAQLAYTRDDAKGLADVQTMTSIGKYAARHWPHIADHVRRDVCALYTPDNLMLLPATTEEIVRSVQEGPKSCMQGGFTVHPYKVYDPSMGWAAAVRLGAAGHIDGRALTWTDPDDEDNKGFVRTYARCFDDGGREAYSHTDQVLAAWLGSEGFDHWSEWPDGTPVAHIRHRHGDVVLPYIDGDNDYVRTATFGGWDCLRICDEAEAEYKGENQNGFADEVNSRDTIGDCTDCGEVIYEDDNRTYVGREQDGCVCESCEEYYTLVEGVRRHFGATFEYYIRDDRAIDVNGTDYDSEYLPDNIVQLEDGDYIDTDADDYCVIDDEYYLCDDSRVVYCADSEYRLKIDCWQCAESDEWYSDDEDYERVDGEKVHPDNLENLRAEQQVAPLFLETEPAPTAWPFDVLRAEALAAA